MSEYWKCGHCGEKNDLANVCCGGCETFKPEGFPGPYNHDASAELELEVGGRRSEIGDQKYPAAALDRQVGGNHYVLFDIQPVEFIVKNELEFLPGCIIKRICRFDRHGGKGLEDLEKAKHEVDLLIQLKFGESAK